jgi:hypothetical protein
MDSIDLRRLANPRFFLVHQNRAQRLRVHALDDAGAIGVESVEDARPLTAAIVRELLAEDRLTHIQTNDPQMARYLGDVLADADGKLPCRILHIDTDVPMLEEW